MIVKARDFFGSGFFCVNGCKNFCDAYGLDYHKLVREGYEHEELLKLSNNDAQAVKNIDYALKKAGK